MIYVDASLLVLLCSRMIYLCVLTLFPKDITNINSYSLNP